LQSGVVFGATGFVSPSPLTGVAAGTNPWTASQSRTVLARVSDNFIL
jgi:hypothetical protein